MVKVLLITQRLDHYRVPLFNCLSDSIKLTIAHEGSIIQTGCFDQIQLVTKKVGPFYYFKWDHTQEFDVIIYPFNVRILNLFSAIFRKRKNKIGLFGIGVAASYSKKYDQKNFLDLFRRLYLSEFDFSIFYEQYPYIKYKAMGIDPNKMSIAYNTVANNPKFDFKNKTFESILFIGSLYKQKKIFDLLKAFCELKRSKNINLRLEIVGNGDEFNHIKSFIIENGLESSIILHGEITDDEAILPIMERSVVCISPGQAGLSVQKCFSYGVGFVTTRNAITGGESFSIIENVTGDYYDGTISDLSSTIAKYEDKEYSKSISRNSYNFYCNFRNIDIWKSGFLKNIINNDHNKK